jgi:excisionase family DNA binding protein
MSTARPEVTGRAPILSVSVAEACRLTGLGRAYIWLLIKDGRLRTTSVGRRRLVIYTSLRDLIEGRREAAKGVASAPGQTHQGSVHEPATITADGGKLQTP